MRQPLPASLVLLCAFTQLQVSAASKSLRLTVSAGDIDRHESVVSFRAPAAGATGWRLEDEQGREVPLQTDDRGQAWFIERELAKGTHKSYRLVSATTPPARVTSVNASRDGSRIKIAVGERDVLAYQAETGDLPRPDINPLFHRGGYIHPVFSPSGKRVTDDYPADHVHHHGIWSPWTSTVFEGRQPDFWNMGQGKGKVEFVELSGTWGGPVHGGVRAQHRFVDLLAAPPKVALNESWEVAVYNVGQGQRRYRMFDLVSTQECAGASPLKLPKYHYGGLGFRGHGAWNGKDKTFFLTSEGETDRVKGNETRGRWCHIGGLVDGELTGIAVLCHPGNFRAPQPMRLHPTEPFFCYAPSQLGDWEIAPGTTYVSRYRFVVADGHPDKAELDRLWNDYASPPTVAISD